MLKSSIAMEEVVAIQSNVGRYYHREDMPGSERVIQWLDSLRHPGKASALPALMCSVQGFANEVARNIPLAVFLNEIPMEVDATQMLPGTRSIRKEFGAGWGETLNDILVPEDAVIHPETVEFQTISRRYQNCYNLTSALVQMPDRTVPGKLAAPVLLAVGHFEEALFVEQRQAQLKQVLTTLRDKSKLYGVPFIYMGDGNQITEVDMELQAAICAEHDVVNPFTGFETCRAKDNEYPLLHIYGKIVKAVAGLVRKFKGPEAMKSRVYSAPFSLDIGLFQQSMFQLIDTKILEVPAVQSDHNIIAMRLARK